MWQQIPFLKRLIPSLRKVYTRLFWPGGFTVRRRRGALFVLQHANYMDRQLAFDDVPEPQQMAFLANEIRRHKSTAFFDIGANIGYYSCILGCEFPALQIYAFEPDPRNAVRLRQHLWMNNLASRASVHETAVSDQAGEAFFALAAAGNTGRSQLSETPTKFKVARGRLDDLLPMKQSKIAIKIDIEGYESAAIAGMHHCLTENDCLLQIEIFPENVIAVKAALAALGYQSFHQLDDDYYFLKA
jgi:FkbM family methyltransferase